MSRRDSGKHKSRLLTVLLMSSPSGKIAADIAEVEQQFLNYLHFSPVFQASDKVILVFISVDRYNSAA